jgi:hypothetical protein
MSRQYPVRDEWRRCAGLAYAPERPTAAWQRGEHRCGLPGYNIRDGRFVCNVHRDRVPITYVCENEVAAYAAAMARALGDAP